MSIFSRYSHVMSFKPIFKKAAVLFALVILTGCKSGEDPAPTFDRDVYILGGDSFGAATRTDFYWKNGTRHLISDNNTAFFTNQILVQNDEVIVTGNRFYDSNWRSNYWSGGEFFTYSGFEDVTIVFMIFEGQDQYLLGFTGQAGTREDKTYFYARNGVRTDLPGTTSAQLQGIAVHNGEVHVIAEATSATYNDYSPLYWIDGELQNLDTDGLMSPRLYDIEIENGNVYLLGSTRDQERAAGNPVIWANGQRTVLNPGLYETTATDLAVENGNTYVLGGGKNDMDERIGFYYENNSYHVVNSGDNVSFFQRQIAVVEGHIYIVGIVRYPDDSQSGLFLIDNEPQEFEVSNNSYFIGIHVE